MINKLTYRAEIDGLRAISVISVILFHAGFKIFSGGFIGVDVFFVISGYLITSILLEEIENDRFSIIRFYERRARRILPALFVVIIACLPFAWFWLLPDEMLEFSRSLIAVSLFVSNILFWKESGYFDSGSAEKPLLHTWSLAVEEQFYIVFPIVLFLIWKYGKDRAFITIAVMALVSLVLSEWSWRVSPDANFYLAPTRAWELLAGSLSVFIVRRNGEKGNDPLSLIGLACILVSIFAYDETTPFPSVYALLPVTGVVLLLLFGASGTVAARILSNRIFVGLGLISYSAYLWHQPVIAFARIKAVEELSPAIMGLLIIGTLVLAYLSWRFIEQPFRQKHKVSRVGILAFSGLGTVTLVAAGSAVLIGDGFTPQRFRNSPELSQIYPEQDQKISKLVRNSNNETCRAYGFELLPEEKCFSNSENPRLMIIGDSRAMAFASAIFAGYYDVPTVMIAAHSCLSFPNVDQVLVEKKSFGNNCRKIAEMATNIPKKIHSLEKVIIVNHAPYGEDMVKYYFGGRKISEGEAFEIGYKAIIDSLEKQGLEVHFVADNPRLPHAPLLCFYRSDLAREVCQPKRDAIMQDRKGYFAEIDRLRASRQFAFHDTTSVLCRGSFCDFERDGKLLYFDQTHLTPYGASVVIDGLLKEEMAAFSKKGKM